MFHTDAFPSSILAALDALAELGKVVQEQVPTDSIANPENSVSATVQMAEHQDGQNK